MNSSEPLQPLTPHEEKLTAYLDGGLPPEDAAAFARQCPEAVEMKAQHDVLAKALRTHSVTPGLRNGEFFNHQILRQITPPAPAREKKPAFPLWRLVFASACCLLAALGIYHSLPTAPSAPVGVPKYLAQVTHVEAGDELLTAKLVNADGLAIVWVDGMDRLAKDYILQ